MSDDLHTYIEPELEARITALALGEVSEFDVEELERQIARQPELAIFYRRMQAMHNLLGETVKAEKDQSWQLSDNRRAALRRAFADQPAASVLKTGDMMAPKSRGSNGIKQPRPGSYGMSAQKRSAISIAACLIVCLVIFSLMAPTLVKQGATAEKFTPEIISYQAARDENDIVWAADDAGEGKDDNLGTQHVKGRDGLEDRDAEASKFDVPAVADVAVIGRLFQSKSKLSKGEKKPAPTKASSPKPLGGSMIVDHLAKDEKARSMTRAVERKPAAQSSSMAKVIAANTHSNTAIPLPEIKAPDPAIDFGDGDDFGDGWGNDAPIAGDGGGGSGSFGSVAGERRSGLAGRTKKGESRDEALDADSVEEITEEAFVAEGKKNQDRSTYAWDASGIAQKEIARRASLTNAADRQLLDGRRAFAEGDYKTAAKKYEKGVALLPPGPATNGRRAVYQGYLSDANIELSNRFRRLGKYDEARELLDRTLQQDPNNRAARKQLSYLDDPLRNGAALSAEHAVKVDEVRKNLYRGEGLYNLGKYDDAKKEMQDALRTDPYNKAARRWLEKIETTKSDYYKAAYDQTRASLLTEVDKAWEMSVADEVMAKKAKPAPVPSKVESIVNPAPRPKALPEETSTAAQPFSTFSLNVADVSFKLAKVALLEKGQWPDASKMRSEEFVNAFDYGDPSPRRGEPVACAVEQTVHPFLQQRNLLRIGMKTAAIGRSTPLRLTVLLDNSGSMEREDREASVLAAMRVLASQLGPDDQITLVGFARQPRLLADRVRGDQAMKLVNIVANTPSEGGTNLEEALRLARKLAKRQHSEGAQDRVVLITDGVANLGNTVPKDLAREIETMRQQGIAFDACGVGAEDLNDEILEALTRKGDGRYYFLNRPEDADSGFAKQLAGALTPAAKNVKVQVMFNPKRVSKYRLLGFEKHRLNKEDFRNDKVDAAEMAAEEAGNAVYQIEAKADGEGDLGEVFVRFLDAGTGKMVERSWTLPYEPQARAFDLAKPSMQLAATAAMLGEKLHGTDAGSVRFSSISHTLGKLRGHYMADSRVQDLIRMCEKVK